jgi:hypothetical protein
MQDESKNLFDRIFGGRSKKDTSNTKQVKPGDTTTKTRKQLRQERREQRRKEKELEELKKGNN